MTSLTEHLKSLQLDNDDWLASKECEALNARAQTLLQNDALSSEEIDRINYCVPERHRELFWDRLAAYFDQL